MDFYWVQNAFFVWSLTLQTKITGLAMDMQVSCNYPFALLYVLDVQVKAFDRSWNCINSVVNYVIFWNDRFIAVFILKILHELAKSLLFLFLALLSYLNIENDDYPVFFMHIKDRHFLKI